MSKECIHFLGHSVYLLQNDNVSNPEPTSGRQCEDTLPGLPRRTRGCAGICEWSSFVIKYQNTVVFFLAMYLLN